MFLYQRSECKGNFLCGCMESPTPSMHGKPDSINPRKGCMHHLHSGHLLCFAGWR
ncbi:unnamed protein product [Musa acuminata subsp. malaccensis]|uniref:(wild Malaysian banana) hypothetical protein n=1 Tax=Musa acuminata subsp. malaccensis TaxID=214687 RepID=A0A804IZH6_MUSAM|nr:unnamed protein product [Musa acuminata subsp. malaccensis]